MSDSGFRAILIVLGASQLALAAWMVVSPGSFFDTVAGFGTRNDHLIRDAAAFTFAIAIGLLVAAARPSWRLPMLAVAAGWYLAHALNHLFDIGDAEPAWVGPLDFALLAATGIVLAGLAVVAARSREGRGGA